MPSLVSASVHQDTVRNAHPATELIQLRRAASPAYMALFQSGYDVLRNLWPTLTSADQALHEWEHSLRDTDLPTATKSIFHAEMLYIKIVLLSPSRLKRPLEDYGQRLIFDHAVQYSQTISSLVEDHVNASLCTSYDLLRTIFVARTTVEVVTRCEDICFRSAPPPIPVSLITAQVPPLSGYSGRERLALAIRAFSLLDKVIGTLGRRYRVPKSWTHFRTRFDGVHANLRSRIAA